MADTDDDAEHDKGETPKQELLETFLRNYRISTDAWKEQRKAETEDLAFLIPSKQWTDEARRFREGGASNGVPMPPRPCLAVSLIDQPLQQIKNQQRNAKLGIQIHPQSPNAPDETADVIQGLYRVIERDSPADQARGWAFERAASCGTGAYRILTEYDPNAEGKEAQFDQVIKIERILDQASVTFDPAATKADFSDAEYCHLSAWMPLAKFRAMYPKVKVPGVDEFQSQYGQADPEWVQSDNEGKPAAVKVVEYWYKVHEYKEAKHPDPKYAGGPRMMDEVSVRCAKFTGGEQLLEDYPWNGRIIPIVFVGGREIQPFDGKRRWIGMVTNNKDGQRAFNFSLSQAVESVALEPKAPFVGYVGQFQNHEAAWQQANIRNYAYLEVNPIQVGGQVLPPPQRTQVDGSKMQLAVALSEQARAWVQSGTAMFDPSLGRANGSERSGKAIQSLQQQGDEATSDYLASLVDISLRHEARIVLDLIAVIYDRPGRIAHILDDNETAQMVMLNQPYMEDPQSGALVPVDGEGPAFPPGTKYYDLAKGRYGIGVSVGRSYQTRMQAAADDLGQIISSEPQLLPVVGDLYFQNRDFPNAKEVAERMTRWRQHVMPFLDKPDQPNDPQAAQAENEALKAQMQQMGQQLQEAMQALQTKQVEMQGQIQVAGLKAESAERVANIKAQSDQQIAALKAQLDALKLGSQQAHEAKVMQHDAVHEAAMASAQVGHDIATEAGKAAAQAALAPLKMDPLRDSVGQPLAADSGEV